MTNLSEERAYVLGGRAAVRNILNQCIQALGTNAEEDKDKRIAQLVSEREEALSVLRRLCDVFGDNDWPHDLHLADIIDKHLGRHLHDSLNK